MSPDLLNSLKNPLHRSFSPFPLPVYVDEQQQQNDCRRYASADSELCGQREFLFQLRQSFIGEGAVIRKLEDEIAAVCDVGQFGQCVIISDLIECSAGFFFCADRERFVIV